MKELDKNEMNKITGGTNLPPDTQYNVEIKIENGRKMMYFYDQDGNFVMVKDITEDPGFQPAPEAYQDFRENTPIISDLNFPG